MRNGRVFVAGANKFNHPAAVSFPLMAWGDCQIHQFVLPVSFFRNYGNGNRRVSAIEHGKHVAAFQIAIDHRFLLVAQQEQGEETFFASSISRISIGAIQKQILVPAVGSAICVDSVMTTDVTPAAMHSKALSSLGIMPSAIVPSAFSCL